MKRGDIPKKKRDQLEQKLGQQLKRWVEGSATGLRLKRGEFVLVTVNIENEPVPAAKILWHIPIYTNIPLRVWKCIFLVTPPSSGKRRAVVREIRP